MPTSVNHRRSRPVLAAALLSLLGLTVALAGPVLVGSPAVAAGHPKHPGHSKHPKTQTRAVITFDKNPDAPDDSLLSWTVLRKQGTGPWQQLETASWRAGSGMLGKQGVDACVHDVGWLPNGTYHVRQYDDYAGNLIKGRAFRLSDKACRNGTVRHNLFIHTEQGAGSRQCKNAPGDQVCRWEFPGIDDYKSAGCIKLAPGDLADLTRRYHRYFRAGASLSTHRLQLKVVS